MTRDALVVAALAQEQALRKNLGLPLIESPGDLLGRVADGLRIIEKYCGPEKPDPDQNAR